MGSATLQGIASSTANAPLIAITSNSEVAQQIKAACIGDASTSSASFELAPGTTAVVRACGWERMHDADLNLMSTIANDQQSAKHSIGMSISSDGVPGAFYAFGFALNGSSTRAQLQPVDFYDPKMLASSKIVYAGVPVGPNQLIQPGTYVPVVTLVNFSKQRRSTSIHYVDSSSGAPRVQNVQQISLPPFSSQTIELPHLSGSGLQNSFILDSDGQPGDVQAHLFSKQASTDQRVELLAKDPRDDHNGETIRGASRKAIPQHFCSSTPLK